MFLIVVSFAVFDGIMNTFFLSDVSHNLTVNKFAALAQGLITLRFPSSASSPEQPEHLVI
jgi:hypothetical protein